MGVDAEVNPYTLGSGRLPPALSGRDATIDGFDLVVARSKRGVTSTTASTTADVVKPLGSNQKSSSVTRSQLISKGLIYSPEHGRIAFNVPAMTDFLHRQDPAILRGR